MKLGHNELPILAKFRNDWIKIADFLIKAYFWLSPDSPLHVCIMSFLFKFASSQVISIWLEISINWHLRKNAPNLQKGGSTSVLPTSHVIRVVWHHKQGNRVLLYFLKCKCVIFYNWCDKFHFVKHKPLNIHDYISVTGGGGNPKTNPIPMYDEGQFTDLAFS